MTFDRVILAIVSLFVLLFLRERKRFAKRFSGNRELTAREKRLRLQSMLGFSVALLTTLVGTPFLIVLALLGGFSSSEGKGQSEMILVSVVAVALAGWVMHKIAEEKLRSAASGSRRSLARRR
jgi:uncharacterized membrane protein YfcA